MKNLISILSFAILLGCSTQKEVLKDFNEDDSDVNLYAFIGKKIFVTQFDPNAEQEKKIEIDSITGDTIIRRSHIMDLGFRCRYLVVKNIFNRLKKDTVDFLAYDHYGRPRFEESENVLLYISITKDGQYYHQKYQFQQIETDADGKFYGTIYKVRKGRKYETHTPKRATIEELFYSKKNKEFKELFKK